jgi:hypothetical protein
MDSDTDDTDDTEEESTVQQPIATEEVTPDLLNTLTEQINQLFNTEMNPNNSKESDKDDSDKDDSDKDDSDKDDSDKDDSDNDDSDNDDSDKDDFTNATCNSCNILKENFQDSKYITGTCAGSFESLPGYDNEEYSSL